ncbi:MAG: 50S ribosomal protein L21 [Candidatus Omnitrophota bacterium]
MFAIIEVASRQHKVSVGDTLDIPRIEHKKDISLDKVLLTSSGKDVQIGTPYLEGAKVICDVICDAKGKKVISYKFKKKKCYHRKLGHRDLLTRLKVKEITIA